MKGNALLLRNLMIILISGVLFVSCEKDDEDQQDDLIGTWTSSTGTFDATINSKPILQYFTDEGLSSADAQSAVAFFNAAMQQSFSGTLTFRSDKTYTANLGGQTDSGTWNLSSDRKQITIDPTNGDAFMLDVETLTDDELVVSWTETGQEDINDDTVPETINVDVTMRFTK